MLVKVGIAVQHEAPGFEMRVAAGSACLLHVVLERIGDVVVYHQPHILLVDAHSEG